MKLTSVCGLFLTISLQVFWVADAQDSTNPCCFGYEPIDGLNDGNCYRLLLELGPMSNNQARVACGAMFGAKLITFQNKQDVETAQQFFWGKYGDQLANHPLAARDTGYWTGYLRESHLEDYTNKFADEFFDSYSFDKLPASFFRDSQPDNLRWLSNRTDEPCICRKRISKTHTEEADMGLDDYPCGKQHWAVCMLPGAVGEKVNQNIYNTGWQNYQPGTDAEQCSENWAYQNHEFYEMLINKHKNSGKASKAQQAEELQQVPPTSFDEIVEMVRADILD